MICVAAGLGMALELDNGTILTGQDAWQHQYGAWMGEKGLPHKLSPVVIGAANIMGKIGLPETVGITLMGVFIASFAGTTLDTSTRIQRYVVGELASDLRIPFLTNRWVATSFAVLTAAGLAFATGADGKGAMVLWPLFGSANQLLAALALLLVTLYLKRRGGMKFIVTAVPCVVMLVITTWAMLKNELKFIDKNNWLLTTIGGVIFALAVWMIIEALLTFFRVQLPTSQQKEAAPA